MPELPEVETVRSGLDKHVVGRTIDAVEVLHPRAVRRHLPGPADFEAVLRGRTFTGARRRGKYLWLPLGEDALLAHLGMSGQLLVGDPGRPVSGHVRARFTFTDQGPDLRFTDQRTFGHLVWASGGAELPALIAHIAPDPFEPAFDDGVFIAPAARPADRPQAGAARPVPGQRDRQHLRRRGALAGPAALGPGHRHAEPGRGGPRPRGGPRRPGGRAAGRRDLVRQSLRERERGERLLLAVTLRIRPGGETLSEVRDTYPPRCVHESICLQLPAMPTATALSAVSS